MRHGRLRKFDSNLNKYRSLEESQIWWVRSEHVIADWIHFIIVIHVKAASVM